ncbi:MAG: helix-turn-helix domain-containing protein [Oscillospiraceae bacterium]|nr:helix-turn-helix domain-containing protein [Oscillospiraceae bacterium]
MPRINFAEQLSKFRKKRGMTQETLAGKLNVTPQAVSKWENGSYPDGDLLPQIAKVLDVPLDVLFGLQPEEQPDPAELAAKAIQALPEEERAAYCIRLFYAVLSAFSNISSELNMPDKLLRETYAQLKTDHVLALERLNEDMQYFCFLRVPEQGLNSYAQITDRLLQFFRMLSRREVLQTLYFFGATEHNHLWSKKQLSRHLGLPERLMNEVLEELDRSGAIWELKVDAGADSVYGYTHSVPLESILVLATSFINYLQYVDPNIDKWDNGAFKLPGNS